jgi:hypothetical protein
MKLQRRVFVSMPADQWLTRDQNDLKWGIVDQIESLGFVGEIFFDPRGGQGLAAGEAWSAARADWVARRCVGAAIIGMPRWVFPTPDGGVHLPTEFNHYEGAIAYTLRLPMLVLVQENVLRRVVFDDSYKGYVGVFPSNAKRSWLKTRTFRVPFGSWRTQLSRRRDVFLGYCSTSAGTAKEVKRFLKESLGVTVLDWQTDFSPGRSILNQIEEAADRCSAGVFLFTGDDNLTDGARREKAVPRDNVVFEAGYFINAKGKDHVLIVREASAKMPADLGGDIYAPLKSRANIGPIKATLRRFCQGL